MNQRARIAMTEDEIIGFLRDAPKLQLATINPDGTPHLVTMFYGLSEGKITFWTYGKAQKTRNIGRDARVTCLIEAGEDYFELRGVLIYGTARLIDDRKGVFDVGMGITRRMAGMTSPDDPVGAPEIDDADPFREYVEQTARKRVAFVVEPTRMVSWDHRKLAG